MATLHDYLARKRTALRQLRLNVDPSAIRPESLRATAVAEPITGVRRIRIRHHQILSDSDNDRAGDDLGPTSPELQLGVLGSCLAHVFVMHAAMLEVPLTSVTIEVEGQMDIRAGMEGHEDTPIYPHSIRYVARIESEAAPKIIAELHDIVERYCPILNLLKDPQQIVGTVEHIRVDPPGSDQPSPGRQQEGAVRTR